ncbi:MAG: VCBS repeat-containing protein, partial [Bacteroidota bacterium]
ALLYVFLYRPLDDGTPHWEPVLVDDDSGVGLQVLAEDLNQDGLLDLIVCNKKGLFIFWQEG